MPRDDLVLTERQDRHHSRRLVHDDEAKSTRTRLELASGVAERPHLGVRHEDVADGAVLGVVLLQDLARVEAQLVNLARDEDALRVLFAEVQQVRAQGVPLWVRCRLGVVALVAHRGPLVLVPPVKRGCQPAGFASRLRLPLGRDGSHRGGGLRSRLGSHLGSPDGSGRQRREGVEVGILGGHGVVLKSGCQEGVHARRACRSSVMRRQRPNLLGHSEVRSLRFRRGIGGLRGQREARSRRRHMLRVGVELEGGEGLLAVLLEELEVLPSPVRQRSRLGDAAELRQHGRELGAQVRGKRKVQQRLQMLQLRRCRHGHRLPRLAKGLTGGHRRGSRLAGDTPHPILKIEAVLRQIGVTARQAAGRDLARHAADVLPHELLWQAAQGPPRLAGPGIFQDLQGQAGHAHRSLLMLLLIKLLLPLFLGALLVHPQLLEAGYSDLQSTDEMLLPLRQDALHSFWGPHDHKAKVTWTGAGRQRPGVREVLHLGVRDKDLRDLAKLRVVLLQQFLGLEA
mmetsp:Transcript_51089/g.150646  ORF Transcript_51089/g.150646 Transcript_51089/m.150646 type:complete len:512 (+) Transcript_51089:988-2523(+)